MQFYTSLPASPRLVELAETLDRPHRPVKLLPLSELPPVRPARLGPLRVEHSELLESLAFTNWSLALLANGTWQPDAKLEDSLLADQQALQGRIHEVAALLRVREGAANG